VIIVGAGPGGCVLARRLVDAGVGVLVIEAGGLDQNPAIFDPTRLFDMIGAPEDRAYKSVPQRHLEDREVEQPRGKVLGGTSAINGMIFARGDRADYDTWAYLGNAGWRYEDVLPLFRRIEDFDGGESEYRSVGGPLHVHSRYEPHPVIAGMIEAATQAGIPLNSDYNAERLDGVSQIQFMVKDLERHTAWRAFLAPVLDRPNLSVLTGCDVLRLLFDGEACSGVELAHDGAVYSLSAEHQVVVCAGAFDSPKLLLLSGVGPADHLRGLGIDVRIDLPGVGENLQDHVYSPLFFQPACDIPPWIAGVSPFHGQIFSHSRAGLTGPDSQALLGHLPMVPGRPEHLLLLAAMFTRPASRGTVRLASADPADPPVIDPAYLSASSDVDAVVAGLRLMREVAAQPALDPWRGPEVTPGPDVTSDADLRAFVRQTCSTIYHPACSCKMGVDELAVVDPRLRVYGAERLRVVDASVMPLVTTANTQVPTMMIAERASDELLAELR
jgi:choline dehydrogenase